MNRDGKHSRGRETLFKVPLAAALMLTVGATSGAWAASKNIVLQGSGGFIIGGYKKTIESTNPNVPTNYNRTLSCDHGYVEYFMPAKPRATSIVLWHSSSAQVWQNRYDGGEGFKDKMLRNDYPTYIWDGPRVGRANWSCEPITYTPSNRDQGNFTAWKFGPAQPVGKVPTKAEFYNPTQFPANSPNMEEYWWNTTGSRYDEFDNAYNIELETDAAAIAADSGKLGNQIVYLTNSAGGLRAAKTTAKTTKNNIAGIITYESIGYLFPIGDPESPTLCTALTPACAFGPLGVPLEDFKKLTKLKKIQFVWGDNRPETEQQVILSRLSAKLINKYGGNAEVVKLGELKGFQGATHIPFMDMSNDKLADLLFQVFKKNKLDGYPKKAPPPKTGRTR